TPYIYTLSLHDALPISAHVLLHVAHAVRRLEVEAAGVEAHALADDGDVRMRGLAPAQRQQARRAVRCAADGMDGGEVLFEQGVRSEEHTSELQSRENLV